MDDLDVLLFENLLETRRLIAWATAELIRLKSEGK